MLVLTFFLGLLANFIGYVPPGNINLTLVRITINRGFKEALRFITALSVVEFFFTFCIMHAAKWLSAQVHLDVMIDWIMFALFVILGTVTWRHRNKPAKTNYSNHASIKYGLLLGLINPMQVPFWMICGTYLITHEWISVGNTELIIFSFGSAAGSFLCLFLYAECARYIQKKFALSTKLINTAVAILFFALAGYHLAKRVYLGVKAKQEISVRL